MKKLLAKKINSTKKLTKICENKTVNTKHLKDLNRAKQLICGKKDEKAVTEIERIITAFESAYDLK